MALVLKTSGSDPLQVRILYPPPVGKRKIWLVRYAGSPADFRRKNKLGLTKDDLVKKADVKYTTLMKIEGGVVNKPSVQTMAKIAKALGISVVSLLAGIGLFFVFQKPIFPDNKPVPQIEKNNSTVENSTPEPIPTLITESLPESTPGVIKAPLATMTLKELAAARGIRIGGYYDYELHSETHDRIFEQEFNAMTTGMFWGDGSHPSRTEFDFSEMDYKVNWGQARDMELYGQTLVWFDEAEMPDWLKAAPTAEVEAIMNEYIDTVVGRYAGQIKFWNVVNEAVDYNGALRQNHKWVEAMGNDYIAKAFVRAHAADPTAVLYYNDFDIESNTAKFEGVKALLISLKNQGVPVHALGWQMHVKPGSFDSTTLLARFNEIADLGIDNYITELDVDLCSEPTTSDDVNLCSEPTTSDYEDQKQTYKTIIQTFLAVRRHKTLVIWGLRDGSPNWLTNGHPLLFDENFRKKPAYFGVQEALE